MITVDEIKQMFRHQGRPVPELDAYFSSIVNYLYRLNPALDVIALFDLYRKLSSGHEAEFAARSGVVSTGRRASVEHGRYGGEVYDRVVRQDPFLEFLNIRLEMASVIRRETARESWGCPDGFVQNPEHYYTQEYEDFYVGPSEHDALLRLCVLARELPLREILLGEKDPWRPLVDSGVRWLGRGTAGSGSPGNKEAGFLLFDRLGLPYPPGIVLSGELLRLISSMELSDFEKVLPYLVESLGRVGTGFAGLHWAVRSNPRFSMPGILSSRLKVRGRAADLLEAIKFVVRSWDSPVARQFRESRGSTDGGEVSLIIQQWVSPESPEYLYNSEWERDSRVPLFASGVFATRDPNTGRPGLCGLYNLNAPGEGLMSGRQSGADLNGLAAAVSDIYGQLAESGRKLEDAAGPQEVEFVVSGGKLFFLQTRALGLAVQAEIACIRELEASGRISRQRAIPLVERLQERLRGRKVYRLKPGCELVPLAEARASTCGACQGFLAFNVEQAQALMQEGKPVVFVISDRRSQTALWPLLFAYPRSAIITIGGNGYSHEAVLCRLAGIPSLIALKAAVLDDRILIDGGSRRLFSGQPVVIDGDTARLYASPDSEVVEEDGLMADASQGLDIPSLRATFCSRFLDQQGQLRPEFSEQVLSGLYESAGKKVALLQAGSDRKAVFQAELERHFLHDLLCKCKQHTKS